MSRTGSKRWCFTSYKDEFAFDSVSMQYLIVGKEVCPTTGRRHLQGFVCFKKRTALSKLKKLDGAAHFESARGSVTDNQNYCSKEGDSSEWGVAPDEQGAKGGEARKKQYDDARKFAKSGEFEKIESSIVLHCYHNIKRIRQDELLKREVPTLLVGSIVGMWLYGAPGIGKSFFARWFCQVRGVKFFMKSLNKWWDGYDNEEVIIMEDVDHFAAKHLGHSLKIWADESSFFGETKGGTLKLRPLLVIVTSNYTIGELWPDDLTLQEAINRRFFQPFISRRADFEAFICPEELSIIRNGIQKEIRQASSSEEEISSSKERNGPSSSY